MLLLSSRRRRVQDVVGAGDAAARLVRAGRLDVLRRHTELVELTTRLALGVRQRPAVVDDAEHVRLERARVRDLAQPVAVADLADRVAVARPCSRTHTSLLLTGEAMTVLHYQDEDNDFTCHCLRISVEAEAPTKCHCAYNTHNSLSVTERPDLNRNPKIRYPTPTSSVGIPVGYRYP